MPNDNHKTLWEESLAELDTYHAILEPYFGKSVPRAVIEDALKHFEEYKRLKALAEQIPKGGK